MPTTTAAVPARSNELKDKKALRREPVTPSWVGRIPELRPGTYADGMPIHEVQYLCCKLLLHPNKFHSRKSLFQFGEVMRGPAKEHGVRYSTDDYLSQPIKIREVVFIDTDDFRLYNHAFILRRRISYKNGFPISDPEYVFKFRHPDMQVAAETDVRPNILGTHQVKFKCQALPLKEKLGGFRMLYSHNVQFPRSSIGMGRENARDMDALIDLLPALGRVRKQPKEEIHLVSNTVVEEVLQDIGTLDFGQGLITKANVAIWRTRGEHRPLIGEFAFQFRFKDRNQLTKEAMNRAEGFFVALEYAAEDYIMLNAPKTATVYRLLGNPPKSHE